ncbi:hypothetical protein KIPB_015051, partial [Kipferlia bialata]|eukprot:g15051.t1
MVQAVPSGMVQMPQMPGGMEGV